MSIRSLYPDIRPSLLLDFANAKQLDPRITFTRTSTATYVGADGLIKTAGIGQPRFDHDPITGESLGLLIEESRTNTQTNSQPQSGSFTGGDAVLTYNTSTAPNGETEACRIARDGTDTNNSSWRATRSITFNANTMVLSCWAKGQNGNNYFVWSFQNLGGAIVRAGFLLTGDGGTQIITNGNGGHTLQIEKYPDGWYRCIIIGNTQSSGTTTQFLYTASVYGEHASAIGGSTLVWGFQLEAGSFPTSYIPTSGSSATRAKDDALITGGSFESWINKNEGTWLIDFRNLGSGSGLLSISATGGSVHERYMMLNIAADGIFSAAVVDGGVLQTNESILFTPTQTAQFTKAIFAVKDNDFAITANGLTPVTDTSGTVYNSPTQLRFAYGDGSSTPYAHFKTCIYYPKRLTNAQLQTLTK
jgi:hypothetical protein